MICTQLSTFWMKFFDGLATYETVTIFLFVVCRWRSGTGKRCSLPTPTSRWEHPTRSSPSWSSWSSVTHGQPLKKLVHKHSSKGCSIGIERPWRVFHKAFFQWQMTKISDKSADNQSEARISVAYNKNCHLSLMTSFMKHPPVVYCHEVLYVVCGDVMDFERRM